MSISRSEADIYTNLDGLSDLRRQAEKQSPEAIQTVTKQFEALFVQQVLKSAREAKLADGLFDSSEGEIYQDMFDKQIAINLTQGEGIGLAKIIVEQLSRTLQPQHQPNTPINAPSEPVNFSLQDGASREIAPEPPMASPDEQAISTLGLVSEYDPQEDPYNFDRTDSALPDITTVSQAPSPSNQKQEYAKFRSAEQFVTTLWPLAVQSAQQLGLDPKVLLAQAALETGWGKFILANADGQSSHNLFNIKSDERWQGDKIAVTTLEYKDGIAQRERATFRMYPSFQASFNDYVDFIKTNQRYREALNQTADPMFYTNELQKAGYATDPRYAEKVMGVVNSDPMKNALASLKLSLNGTINTLRGSTSE